MRAKLVSASLAISSRKPSASGASVAGTVSRSIRCPVCRTCQRAGSSGRIASTGPHSFRTMRGLTISRPSSRNPSTGAMKT